jgi:hypothetical protein
VRPECSSLIGYVNRNSQEVTLMPRLKEIAKKRSAPSKTLHLSFPDPETLAFWKMSADDPNEYAKRVARFSRALGNNASKGAAQSSERQWQDAAKLMQSRRSKPLGKLLMMPSHPGSKEGL